MLWRVLTKQSRKIVFKREFNNDENSARQCYYAQKQIVSHSPGMKVILFRNKQLMADYKCISTV